MTWNDIQEKKPTHCMCLVVNLKYGFQIFQAVYHPYEDVFIKFDPNDRNTTPLSVTHWIEIPDFPKRDK